MDGGESGKSVEAEVWELLDADAAVADETTYLVAAALQGHEELAGQLGGDAPTLQRPDTTTADGPPPLRAFLRSITVQGFRGIGPRATLELNPYRGITVVSGRNGSGKSSFAEALEYALTGESYRFANRARHWRDSWRNLHADEPALIEVDFAMEPDDARAESSAVVGANWASGADLAECRRWSQIKGHKREPVGALGWDEALVTHRPLMSYDELGGLLEDGPSSLYDALNRLLGLDEIADADSRLKAAEKQLGIPRKTANDNRTQLVRTLDAAADPRAAEVKRLIARKPYDLDAVTATTLGTATDQAATIARLRGVAALEVPDPAKAAAVAAELKAAIDAHVAGADSAVKAMSARATLLRHALHLHDDLGDGPCPVCETGTLDAAWPARPRSDWPRPTQAPPSIKLSHSGWLERGRQPRDSSQLWRQNVRRPASIWPRWRPSTKPLGWRGRLPAPWLIYRAMWSRPPGCWPKPRKRYAPKRRRGPLSWRMRGRPRPVLSRRGWIWRPRPAPATIASTL